MRRDVVAIWAVGDVQGCYDGLRRLLDAIAFDSACDELWLVGDLVNRGPDSLGVLRFLRALGDRASVTLGNHDLHLLAIAFGGHRAHSKDTFTDVLAAPDAAELCHWLRMQPLIKFDEARATLMAHAGIPFLWSVSVALQLAEEVHLVLRGNNYCSYLCELYGNEPNCWRDDLTGMDRLRAITNYFTRMRWLDARGALEFAHKGTLEDAPAGFRPWYERVHPANARLRMLFGHWAALHGLTTNPRIVALDTGYIWGRSMTALSLDDHRLVSVAASGAPRIADR